MERRRRSGIETVAVLPWPLGIIAGIAGFIALRYGVLWWLSHHGGMLAAGFAKQSGTVFAPLAWMLLGFCWLAALVSYLRARRNRRFLDTRTSLESLAAGGWRQFEQLVGEAFRRQGYTVEQTGLGGPDGGIDLILRRNGQRTLVQCKQWKRQQVGVGVVREMAGLLAHYQADAVKIVCIGSYTQNAERFAQGKPIELMGGAVAGDDPDGAGGGWHIPFTAGADRTDVGRVMVTSAPTPAPVCPRCDSALVRRTNRRTWQGFLGCNQLPRCEGTR